MGAWGEGPFDNDAAGDMVSQLMNPIRVVAARKENGGDFVHQVRAQRQYAEARAAARFIVIAHGTDMLGGPSLETVLLALVRIRRDTTWLGSWRTPQRVAKKLDAEIEDVLERMKSCRRCRSTLKISELTKIVKAASEVKVPRTKWPVRKNRATALADAAKKRKKRK